MIFLHLISHYFLPRFRYRCSLQYIVIQLILLPLEKTLFSSAPTYKNLSTPIIKWEQNLKFRKLFEWLDVSKEMFISICLLQCYSAFAICSAVVYMSHAHQHWAYLIYLQSTYMLLWVNLSGISLRCQVPIDITQKYVGIYIPNTYTLYITHRFPYDIFYVCFPRVQISLKLRIMLHFLLTTYALQTQFWI